MRNVIENYKPTVKCLVGSTILPHDNTFENINYFPYLSFAIALSNSNGDLAIKF